MSQEIFLCYRRKDTGGYAGRLFDRLKQEYGSDGVRFDVEVEGTAEILRDWVQRTVPEAAVLLVLIGNEWITDDQGQRRLQEFEDIVRLEIELALLNSVPIIPVLIDGAEIPRPKDLPDSIRKISDFKGYELNNSFWDAKLELLLEAISSRVESHVPIMRRGTKIWNKWRVKNKALKPKLASAKLAKTNLDEANLKGADLRNADLSEASLRKGNLCGVDLTGANLSQANLEGTKAKGGIFINVDMTGANLKNVNFENSDLRHANLNGADLTGANLHNCWIFGVSAWNTQLAGAQQSELRLDVNRNASSMTVDNIEMAVIVHLLLDSKNVREVFHTLTSKTVLILGRFTAERKAVLDEIRSELLKRNYLPILIDYDPLPTKNLIETISTFAHLARFVIADLTDAKSILQDLTIIVHALPRVPVQPLLHKSAKMPPMSDEFMLMPSVLQPYRYSTKQQLLKNLSTKVIDPAKKHAEEIEKNLKAFREKYLPWQNQ